MVVLHAHIRRVGSIDHVHFLIYLLTFIGHFVEFVLRLVRLGPLEDLLRIREFAVLAVLHSWVTGSLVHVQVELETVIKVYLVLVVPGISLVGRCFNSVEHLPRAAHLLILLRLSSQHLRGINPPMVSLLFYKYLIAQLLSFEAALLLIGFAEVGLPYLDARYLSHCLRIDALCTQVRAVDHDRHGAISCHPLVDAGAVSIFFRYHYVHSIQMCRLVGQYGAVEAPVALKLLRGASTGVPAVDAILHALQARLELVEVHPVHDSDFRCARLGVLYRRVIVADVVEALMRLLLLHLQLRDVGVGELRLAQVRLLARTSLDEARFLELIRIHSGAAVLGAGIYVSILVRYYLRRNIILFHKLIEMFLIFSR